MFLTPPPRFKEASLPPYKDSEMGSPPPRGLVSV